MLAASLFPRQNLAASPVSAPQLSSFPRPLSGVTWSAVKSSCVPVSAPSLFPRLIQALHRDFDVSPCSTSANFVDAMGIFTVYTSDNCKPPVRMSSDVPHSGEAPSSYNTAPRRAPHQGRRGELRRAVVRSHAGGRDHCDEHLCRTSGPPEGGHPTADSDGPRWMSAFRRSPNRFDGPPEG